MAAELSGSHNKYRAENRHEVFRRTSAEKIAKQSQKCPNTAETIKSPLTNSNFSETFINAFSFLSRYIFIESNGGETCQLTMQ
jgi:hypothetical protein